MWNSVVSLQEGCFYVIFDDGFMFVIGFDEIDYEVIDVDVILLSSNVLLMLVIGNQNGYVFIFEFGEKVVMCVFVFFGVMVFSIFFFDIFFMGGVCVCLGFGWVYMFFMLSGNGLQQDLVISQIKCYCQMDELVFLNLFIEVSFGNLILGMMVGDLMLDFECICDEFKSFLLDNCCFIFQMVNINVVCVDMGIEFIVLVLICVISKNWKEGLFD